MRAEPRSAREKEQICHRGHRGHGETEDGEYDCLGFVSDAISMASLVADEEVTARHNRGPLS